MMNYDGKYAKVLIDAPYMNGESHIIAAFRYAEVWTHLTCNCSWWKRIRGADHHTQVDHKWTKIVVIKEEKTRGQDR